MNINGFYEPNVNDILFENFDDEIVIINLKNGAYYSLNKTGKLFWELLLENIKPSIILETFKKKSNGSGENNTRVEDFFVELNSEGLIRPVVDSGQENPDRESGYDLSEKFRNITEVPVIEKYTDQQELLLLDPIHEVSDFGWPDKAGDDPKNG